MKLFHKTLRVYLTFSVIIFAVSVPLFYFLVQNLWMKDVDESLVFQKEKIISGIVSSGLDTATMSGFSETALNFDIGISVIPLETSLSETDSIYFHSFYDETRTHVEPFRELKSVININGKSYQVIVRKDLVESVDLIRGIAITQAILFFFLLMGLILLNNHFAKKTWHPFYRLVTRLNTFRIDKQEHLKIEKSDIDEFNDLNSSISRLTENNIRTFKAQKEFIENAAHETQTPLAVIKNQVDLLAQDKNLSREQAKIIGRMDKNVRYLTKLNRNLLLLAKIDNSQFDVAEKVNITGILKETLDIFEEQCRLKGIQIDFNIEGQPVLLSNDYLLQILISNLIKNAVKYNIPSGFIEIELNIDFFRITNSGENRPLPEDTIFKRFYKKSNYEESSGLGLAIAKRICELLEFNLKYSFEEPNGHCFTVNFKQI